jgi:hypothetical protein
MYIQEVRNNLYCSYECTSDKVLEEREKYYTAVADEFAHRTSSFIVSAINTEQASQSSEVCPDLSSHLHAILK